MLWLFVNRQRNSCSDSTQSSLNVLLLCTTCWDMSLHCRRCQNSNMWNLHVIHVFALSAKLILKLACKLVILSRRPLAVLFCSGFVSCFPFKSCYVLSIETFSTWKKSSSSKFVDVDDRFSTVNLLVERMKLNLMKIVDKRWVFTAQILVFYW